MNKRSIFGNRYKTTEVPELIDCLCFDCIKCWKNMELTYYKEEEPGKGDHSYCRRTAPTTSRSSRTSSRTPSCSSPLCLGNFFLVLSLTQNPFHSRRATFTSLCLKTPPSCPLQHLLLSSETVNSQLVPLSDLSIVWKHRTGHIYYYFPSFHWKGNMYSIHLMVK